MSVVLEYRARAEAYTCPPGRVCVPDVKPPDCEIPDCEVEHPVLRRSCERTWQKHFIEDVIRCPQCLCFVDVKFDKRNAVAMVSTINIRRAIGR